MGHSQDNYPRRLKTEEVEALQEDMRQASEWMSLELRRRAGQRRDALPSEATEDACVPSGRGLV
jgi:hypothetical protein